MRKIVCIVMVLLTTSAMAQLSGRIVFEEKITMDFDGEMEGIPDAQRDQIMAMLEKMKVQKSKKELLFSTDACLYKDYEGKGDEEVNVESGNVKMQMVMANPEQKVFRDFKNNTMLDQSDFMGKVFLISEEVESSPWKITKETKEIAGYSCQQAIMINETEKDTVIAWFSKQIPVPAGPMFYGQLPGMILGLSQQGGQLEITATTIELKEMDAKQFEMPTKGKKISRKQYDEMVAKKMAEMEEFQGGEGGMRIEMRMEH